MKRAGEKKDKMSVVAEALKKLPDAAKTWIWLGALAARRGVHDEVASLVPAAHIGGYNVGLEIRTKAPRPDALLPAVRAVERAVGALQANDLSESDLPVKITALTRWRRGEREEAYFDLKIAYRGCSVDLFELKADIVLSYPKVVKAALSKGLTLPLLGRAQNRLWRNEIERAMAEETVRDMPGAVTARQAVTSAIRTAIESAKIGKTRGDLVLGRRVKVEGAWLLKPYALLERVKKELPYDRQQRGTIELVLAELGVRDHTHEFQDDTKARCLLVPTEVLEEDLSALCAKYFGTS